MSKLTNYRTFTVTPLNETNTRPPRVKIVEHRLGKKETKILKYDTKVNYLEDRAIEYLGSIGINLIGRSTQQSKVLLFSDNWGENYINLDGTKPKY